jgi:hypothetical protein
VKDTREVQLQQRTLRERWVIRGKEKDGDGWGKKYSQDCEPRRMTRSASVAAKRGIGQPTKVMATTNIPLLNRKGLLKGSQSGIVVNALISIQLKANELSSFFNHFLGDSTQSLTESSASFQSGSVHSALRLA